MDFNARTFEMHSNIIQNMIMKMSQDNINVVQIKLNLNLLCDLHTLLALSCLLPLLETINALITFPQ
jgi:hypothetical protein